MMVVDMRDDERTRVPGRVRTALTHVEDKVSEMVVLVRSADDESVVRYLAEVSGYQTISPMGLGSRILVLRKAA